MRRADAPRQPFTEGRKFRHELKYLINEGDAAGIKNRISPFVQHDTHAEGGMYMLRSLYYDDLWGTAYAEKLMGVSERRKYRIRIYNASDAVIKLECKEKQGSYIYKRSASLSRAEYDRLYAGDCAFLLARGEEVCKEFYLAYIQRVLRPRVIVDYEREPFVIPAGDVRITFDRDVRAAVLRDDLFDKNLPTIRAIEPYKLVMEVKYTEFLPQIVRDVLPPRASELTAVSKYVLCCDAAGYRTVD